MLKSHHVQTTPSHNDRPPFTMHNKEGVERLCMPNVVSDLESNAFKTKDNVAPKEGQVLNIHNNQWKELDAEDVSPGVCH